MSERRKKIVRLQKMKNNVEISERHQRYSIDPKEFLNVETEARKNGEEIAGIYHSHPNSPSKPSKFDLLHAWPDLSYIIVEVNDGKVISTRSWILEEDKSGFQEEDIEIRN